MPAERLKQLRNDAGIKKPAPECSLHIDWYRLGTQYFPMHICNVPRHSKASGFHFKHVQTKFKQIYIMYSATLWIISTQARYYLRQEAQCQWLRQLVWHTRQEAPRRSHFLVKAKQAKVGRSIHFPPATHCTSTSQGLQSSGKRQA